MPCGRRRSPAWRGRPVARPRRLGRRGQLAVLVNVLMDVPLEPESIARASLRDVDPARAAAAAAAGRGSMLVARAERRAGGVPGRRSRSARCRRTTRSRSSRVRGRRCASPATSSHDRAVAGTARPLGHRLRRHRRPLAVQSLARRRVPLTLPLPFSSSSSSSSSSVSPSPVPGSLSPVPCPCPLSLSPAVSSPVLTLGVDSPRTPGAPPRACSSGGPAAPACSSSRSAPTTSASSACTPVPTHRHRQPVRLAGGVCRLPVQRRSAAAGTRRAVGPWGARRAALPGDRPRGARGDRPLAAVGFVRPHRGRGDALRRPADPDGGQRPRGRRPRLRGLSAAALARWALGNRGYKGQAGRVRRTALLRGLKAAARWLDSGRRRSGRCSSNRPTPSTPWSLRSTAGPRRSGSPSRRPTNAPRGRARGLDRVAAGRLARPAGRRPGGRAAWRDSR